MMKKTTLITTITAVMAALTIGTYTTTVSAANLKSVSDIQPVWRTDVTGTRTEVHPLMKLVPGGMATSVKLTGLSRVQAFDFGVRPDDVVSEASLDLHFTPSPSIAATTSQLNFYLNGRLQRSIPLTADMIGKPAHMSLKLSPKVVETVNQLTVEFIGHTSSVCENPADAAIWLDIGAESKLTLVKQRIRLANDLASFPSPFVDTVTGAPTVLPMVFAGHPTDTQKEAAAILSSVVGRMTEWRGADFPVFYQGTPAAGHYVVFATNEKRPEFLQDLPRAEGPMVSITDAPGSLYSKVLVISGRNDEDLLAAVRALAVDRPVMVGERFKVKKVEVPPVREAYDAPRWINTDVEIPFSKLIQYPGQLSARGYTMPQVHLPVKLVPDLYMVGDAVLGMQVNYRYAKPMPEETAQFRTFINGFLADSDTLAGKDGRGTRQVHLPSFYGSLAVNDSVGPVLTHLNDLSFSVDYERTIQGGSKDNCRSVMLIAHQMEIEPTSTLTIKGLYHHAELPDLKLFARSGFPFTKYADLSQTAILMSDKASETEMTTMLNTVGRMAAMTGAPALHVRVTGDMKSSVLADRDILAVGRFPVEMTNIDEANATKLQKQMVDDFATKKAGAFTEALAGNRDNGVSAVVSAESPLSNGRTVVALLSEGGRGAAKLNAELVNPAGLGTVTGAVAILNDAGVTGFQVGEKYTVGNLPWYHKVWMSVIDRPVVLVVCALLSALFVGFGIFTFMRLWVRRRA